MSPAVKAAVYRDHSMHSQKMYRIATMVVKQKQVHLFQHAIDNFLNMIIRQFNIDTLQSSQEEQDPQVYECLQLHIDFQRQVSRLTAKIRMY